MKRRNFVRVCAALAPALFFGTAQAQAQAWPAKPIKLVVAQATGSGSDVVGRLLAAKLGEALGQSMYVENRAGGGGLIGHEFVRGSEPDGYTLLLTSTAPLIVVPAVNQNAKYKLTDFTPVASVLRSPFMILVSNRPAAPVSLADLVRLLKTGDASYSSAGMGTLTHLVSEMFLTEIGAKAIHVAYKGSGQSLTDLMGGQVLFSADSTTAAGPLIRSGKLRALAVTSPQRLSSYPDVPTLAELGLPALTVSTIVGLFGPAGVPKGIVERVSSETMKALASPELKAQLAAAENEALMMTPDELQAQLLREAPKWQQLVRRLGVTM